MIEPQVVTVTTDFDTVFGIEPSGFITGSSIAYSLGKAFVPVRRQGKLPSNTIAIQTEGETLEVHEDAVKPGANVLVIGTSEHVKQVDAVARELESRGLHVQKRCE